MALGGGTFTSQNKVLPGAYINFVSLAAASATLSDRGVAAMGLEIGWGPTGDVFEITNEDFINNSFTFLGYAYDADALKPLRDIFKNATKVYAYRLNGGGAKASNTFATAKYAGTRGNDITIVIAVNVDDNDKWDVSTYVDTTEVDKQVVASAADLVSNDWVDFDTTATLAATSGTALTGGTNSTVDSTAHQTFLSKLESYTFNALGYVGTTDTIKSLYVAYTKRLRDEVGKKFVTAIYSKAADYEGVVNVKNAVTDAGADTSSLVYWVVGLLAGMAVNASATNNVYTGEYTPNTSYTQAQLEAAINAGEFTLHNVDDTVRVLTDINSLTTTTDEKGDVFKSNQTVRVCDQIAMDIAALFNTKYLGNIPNDASGRASLWLDIVKHHEDLESIRAIEDFDEDDVVVEQGNTKQSVVVTDAITVVNSMEKLYMTVTVQ